MLDEAGSSEPLYLLEIASLRIVKDAGWASGPFWIDVKMIQSRVPTRVRTPNRPTCGDSLCRLHYPDSLVIKAELYFPFMYSLYVLVCLILPNCPSTPPSPRTCFLNRLVLNARSNFFTYVLSGISSVEIRCGLLMSEPL